MTLLFVISELRFRIRMERWKKLFPDKFRRVEHYSGFHGVCGGSASAVTVSIGIGIPMQTFVRQQVAVSLTELRKCPCGNHRGRSHRFRHSDRRSGLTLLEILLSVVILATSMAVLAQQTTTAVRAALRSRLETEAAAHCQSLMNRILASRTPASEVAEQPIEDHKTWLWSCRISATPYEHLRLLTISVRKFGKDSLYSEFSLSRLIPLDSDRSIRTGTQFASSGVTR